MVKNYGFGPEPNRYISITEIKKKVGNRWVTTKVDTTGLSETQYRNSTNLDFIKMGLDKDMKVSRSFGRLYGKRSVISMTYEYHNGKDRMVSSYFELKDAREILKNIRRP